MTLARNIIATAPGTGLPAGRIASLTELYAVNTFSSLIEDANLWGSWPADYRPTAVLLSRDQIVGTSGFNIRYREYHYETRTAMQTEWLQNVTSNGDSAIMCIGDNGSDSDVPTMVTMANDPTCRLQLVEGLNEPNWDNGSGVRTWAETQAAQAAIFAAIPSKAVGPSLVAGMPSAGSYVEAYVTTHMDLLVGEIVWANAHYYPPGMPDATDGTGFAEYIASLMTAYQNKRLLVTEFHPSLFQTDTAKRPGGASWDGFRDAMYTLRAMLIGARAGIGGLWWFALFDYGMTYDCGMFPVDQTNPRPIVGVLAALFAIAHDNGANRHDFVTGSLPLVLPDVTPSGVSVDLYQASDGRFLLFVSLARVDPGGASVPYPIGFPSNPQTVTEYNLTTATSATPPPVQSLSHPSTVTVQLDGSVRLLEVIP